MRMHQLFFSHVFIITRGVLLFIPSLRAGLVELSNQHTDHGSDRSIVQNWNTERGSRFGLPSILPTTLGASLNDLSPLRSSRFADPCGGKLGMFTFLAISRRFPLEIQFALPLT